MEPLAQEQLKQENNYRVASVFERAIAFVIDFMLWVTVSSFLYQIINTSHKIIYAIISVLAFVLYAAIFSTGNLKTVGKFLLGIKVIDRKTKQNLTFKQAFLRAVGYIINFFTAFLGFAFVLFPRNV